ncbi:MAG: hypothetical protein E2O29_02120 [Deltaproteobacteria bacterium]|nr:MAG: hypothetical protein E2O29_02120 [Deltaproteobacteria bacterium]
MRYAKLLGISDYKFEVDIVLPSKIKKKDKISGSYATVYVDEETRTADIELNKKLLLESPKELDSTIAHELLHVRFNELDEFVHFLIKTYVKDEKARKTYRNQMELLEHKNIIALIELVIKSGKLN